MKVISFSRTKNGVTYWKCKCDCGKTKEIAAGNLTGGKTHSCGCLQKIMASESSKTHGESKTKLYRIWKGMRTRCYNPNSRAYKNYGGRGILVCDEWEHYEAFKTWAIQNGYSEGLTIERIDNDGMYEPGNCEWISLSSQTKNTRRNHYIVYDGRRMTLSDWSKELGGNPNLVTTRLQRGWSEEDAVTTPPGGTRKLLKKA